MSEPQIRSQHLISQTSQLKSHGKPSASSRKTKSQQKKAFLLNSKEESLREILGFFTNQVDVKKFLKKPQSKKAGQEGHEEIEEKTQDEFLNQNEFAEVKGSYDDYGFGDTVIVFLNPDHVDTQNKAVTFKDAEKVYDEILTIMTNEGVSKQQMKKERDSFLLAFLTLQDYAESEGAEKKKKKEMPKYKKLKNENKTDEPDALTFKRKEKNSYEKYLDFVKLWKKQEDEQKLIDDDPNRADLHSAKKNQVFLDEIGAEPEGQEQNLKQGFDPLKELLKVDITNTNQFKKVKKCWSHGGYLEQRWLDENDYQWVSQNGPPKDFMTLVRSTVITKLTRNGFLHCRQFVSLTGTHIFMVLKSNKEVLMRQAQLMKITKQLELGYADLFSLEPVDNNLRPMRLKNFLRQINDEEVKKKMAALPDMQRPNFKNQGDIDLKEYGKKMYADIKKWTEVEFRAQLIRKQTEVDRIMKLIAKELHIDLSHEKVELINDIETPRDQWEVYFLYLEYFHCYIDILSLVAHKNYNEIKTNIAFIYKMIFNKALSSANAQWYAQNVSFWRDLTNAKSLIFNIWGKLNVEPVAPYTEFFQPIGEAAEIMWRKFIINEKGERSIFLNMEKVKITHAIVLGNVNILKLISEELAFFYFPLHDPFQLRGFEKKPQFQALVEGQLMEPYIETIGEIEFKKLMAQLNDENETLEFDTISFQKACEFNWKRPWYIPITSVRYYFGEKIALYFAFLSFTIKQLGHMSLIALLTQLLMSQADEQSRDTMIIIFSVCIVVWSAFFIELWKREQILFAVQYGQLNFEEDEAERPAFEGQYIRSITNDDLNEQFYSPFKRKMKQLMSLSISFVIISCVIGCVLGILTFKQVMLEKQAPPFTSQTLPGLMQSVNIAVFDAIYQIVVMVFNNFENHKILDSYENSLLAKIFLFRFVNNLNMFFIIAFLEGYFTTLQLCSLGPGTEPKPTDCFYFLESQISVIFVSTFQNQPMKLLVPWIVGILKEKAQSVDENPEIHPFNEIDKAVEKQFALDPYQTNPEVDGSVLDYIELTIQFSFLCLFGLAFPSAYLIGFGASIFKLQVDKEKLVRFMKRPLPQGAATIGNWLVILEVITFFGIFSNAGLVVYTSHAIKENQLVVFSSLLVFFLAVKYFIRFLVPSEPEAAIILNKRHQYVVDRVVKGLATSNLQSYTPARVNLRIEGVTYGAQSSNVYLAQSSNRNNEIEND